MSLKQFFNISLASAGLLAALSTYAFEHSTDEVTTETQVDDAKFEVCIAKCQHLLEDAAFELCVSRCLKD